MSIVRNQTRENNAKPVTCVSFLDLMISRIPTISAHKEIDSKAAATRMCTCSWETKSCVTPLIGELPAEEVSSGVFWLPTTPWMTESPRYCPKKAKPFGPAIAKPTVSLVTTAPIEKEVIASKVLFKPRFLLPRPTIASVIPMARAESQACGFTSEVKPIAMPTRNQFFQLNSRIARSAATSTKPINNMYIDSGKNIEV